MAIVSVSKIQHRRGLLENLPQLGSAELGWAIDSRRLFIGNGTEDEGAPEIGNTEILTVYSDIMALLDTYTYKGERGGYTVSTGDVGSPIVRTFQDKFDDIVNVRDFGAVGDGVTDDTAAINRALYELFCRNANTAVRRALYFSAGVYLVSDVIKIPSYATLLGEGLRCVVIKQTDMSFPVAKLADSLQQIDVNNGSGSGVSSRYIDVRDVTFALDRPAQTVPDGSTAVENDLVQINKVDMVRFSRCGFQGYRNLDADIQTVMDSRSGLKLNYTGVESTVKHVIVDNCEFQDLTYGVMMDEEVSHVAITKSKFYHVYQGIQAGANSVTFYPKGVSVTQCNFDKVYGTAVETAVSVNDVVSSFNAYRDVGNGLVGEGYTAPPFAVIDFGDEGCVSICDFFARNDTADAVTPRVEMNGNSIYFLRPRTGITFGYVTTAPSGAAALSDNIATPTTTGITLDINIAQSADLVYQIIRTNQVRHGILKLTHDATNQNFSEDYNENNGDVGVNLSISYSSNVTSVTYTTTSTGNVATMHYQMRYVS